MHLGPEKLWVGVLAHGILADLLQRGVVFSVRDEPAPLRTAQVRGLRLIADMQADLSPVILWGFEVELADEA